jgi:hypothetical protein
MQVETAPTMSKIRWIFTPCLNLSSVRPLRFAYDFADHEEGEVAGKPTITVILKNQKL